MKLINKETATALVALLLVGWGVKGLVAGAPEAGRDPRPKPFQAPPAPRRALALEVTDALADASIGRELFQETREEEDLPPVELALPPIPERAPVAPPTHPGPSPVAWGLLRQPGVSVLEALPADNPAGGSAGEGEKPAQPARPPGGEAANLKPPPAAPAAEPAQDEGAKAAAQPEKAPAAPPEDPRKRFDSLFVHQKTVFGKFQVADPLALIGEELPGQENRFKLKEGTTIQFEVVLNPTKDKSNRSLVPFKAADVEFFSLAETTENLYKIRRRKLADADFKGAMGLGWWCAERGDLKLAQTEFRRAAQLSPRDPEPHRALGQVLGRDQRWEEEWAVYEAATRAGIEDAELAFQQGRLARRLGLTGLARTSLERALSLRPDLAPAATELGHLFLAEHALGQAEESFEKAARLATASSPEGQGALEGLGSARLARGKVEEAKAAFQQLLDAVPGHPDALAGLGSCAFAARDLENAAKRFEEAVRGEKGGDNRLNLAGVLASQGKLPSAGTRLDEAAKADPLLQGAALAGRGFVLEVGGKKAEALERFREAQEVIPEDPYVLFAMGRAHAAMGNHQGAREAYEKAVALVGPFPEACLELAASLVALGDGRSAERYARRYLVSVPGSREAATLLGQARLLLRDLQGAKEAFGEALKGEEEYAPALNGMAWYFYASEEITKAIGTLQRVLGMLKPEDPGAVYAAATLKRIQENAGKVLWRDEFTRGEIKRQWDLVRGNGVNIALVRNQVRFQGAQDKEETALTQLKRTVPDGGFVAVEGEITTEKRAPGRKGVFLFVPRNQQDDPAAGIWFAKDSKGKLIYRVIDRAEVKDWQEVPGVEWPEQGAVRLGIECTDHEGGLFALKLNGAAVKEPFKVASLAANRRQVKTGFFGTAKIGEEWAFDVDNVRIVRRKG